MFSCLVLLNRQHSSVGILRDSEQQGKVRAKTKKGYKSENEKNRRIKEVRRFITKVTKS